MKALNSISAHYTLLQSCIEQKDKPDGGSNNNGAVG